MSLRAALENGETPPETWSSFMADIYRNKNPPVNTTYDFDKLEEKAREVTKDYHAAFLYTFGSAGSGSTNRANRQALKQWRIVPRMLRDASDRTLETTLFGVKYKSPILVAPIGVQGIMHRDGELATARAAAKVGVPFIMSSASSRSIEDVAEANGAGPRWFQLYWPRTDAITLSLLARAKAAGFTALVVTLDTMLLGWRPHDLDAAYLPFAHGVGIQIGTSDPAFMAAQQLPVRPRERPAWPFDAAALDARLRAGDAEARANARLGARWLAQLNSGLFRTWEDVAFLRAHWEGPIVLKGIQAVADAHRAMDVGVDGIVVSNHGGRQIDGAVPSFVALEQIMLSRRVTDAQRAGTFTVLFDSGIRSGSDVIKALAMGAQAVLVARPYMYGLAVGGERGVEEVLRALHADTEITLGLSGYKNVGEVWHKKEEVMVKV
ncbi:lactate 2-monooxygenase [Heterobasidion irregulare TC 32-1]|uniref:Lactate 2-monooxygenase n=1 Tax=Heterobasidion irregulare (strain TC 32-1) TaxID=747525 RepID=W4K8W3_HETIT|nr:lactate 2-monooxygenase [Heterobasidion irregulare TC 32-1]ETW82228.1 lactate 2-monooxygenase [Heterobasidion irregulare TC 32-1]